MGSINDYYAPRVKYGSLAYAGATLCVTTDVGDAVVFFGETDWVVPPKSPQIVAVPILKAIEELQTNNQSWLNSKAFCRNRIIDNFSIEKMVVLYHQAWGK